MYWGKLSVHQKSGIVKYTYTISAQEISDTFIESMLIKLKKRKLPTCSLALRSQFVILQLYKISVSIRIVQPAGGSWETLCLSTAT